MISSLLLLISGSLAICWSLPFIVFTFFGLQFYKVSGQKLVKMLKNLPKRSSIASDDNIEGWVLGYPYIGFIKTETTQQGGEKKELFILTTKHFFKKISDGEDKTDLNDNTNTLVLWERNGNFFHLWYTKRNFQVTSVQPRSSQILSIDLMLSFYQSHDYCMVLQEVVNP